MKRLARLLVASLGLAAGLPATAAPVLVVSQSAAQVTRIEPGATEPKGKVAVGPAPAAIAADAVGRVYLSHPDAKSVTILDLGENGAARRLPYDGQAFGIAADPDGAHLYVADWTASRVSRLASESGAVEGTVEVGKDPAHVLLDRAGRLYVADRESHQVSVIDTARMERIATIPVGTAPFALGLSPNQDRLYVANVRSNDLTVIDTQSLKPIKTVPVGAMPYGVATSADGKRVLVTNQHAGTVTVLDAETLTIEKTIKVGQYPEGIAVTEGRAYVANWFSDNVSVIDLATLKETGRIGVGEGPRSLCLGTQPPSEASR